MPCTLFLYSRFPGAARGLGLASLTFPRLGGCEAWNGASKEIRLRALTAEFEAQLQRCSSSERTALQSAKRSMVESGANAKACTSLIGDLVKIAAPLVAIAAGGVGLAAALKKQVSGALQKKDVTPPIVGVQTGNGGPPNPTLNRASTSASAPARGIDTSKLALVGVGLIFVVGLVAIARQ